MRQKNEKFNNDIVCPLRSRPQYVICLRNVITEMNFSILNVSEWA